MREGQTPAVGNDQEGQALGQGRVLLLVTPYSPLRLHGHAADDLGQQLVETLSTHYELHVYAPSQSRRSTRTGSGGLTTFHSGSESRPTFWRHLGIYPAGLRKDWSRRNTRELRQLLKQLKPNLVHVEYLQPAEAIARMPENRWSITLHDITSRVFRQRANRARGIDMMYRWVEYWRVLTLEMRVATKAKRVFTLSARDALWVRSVAPTQEVSHVKIGMTIPLESWNPEECDPLVFVFAGAMWRKSNEVAALFLAKSVMPVVWRTLPQAVLRIVGARPSPVLLELAQDARIEVAGHVPSIELEYTKAAAVLAPTFVDAGVLLKALRALACGAPLIVNTAAASPLEVIHGVQCYICDSPEEMARRMIEISGEPKSVISMADAGRKFVANEFSWDGYGRDMGSGIGE